MSMTKEMMQIEKDVLLLDDWSISSSLVGFRRHEKSAGILKMKEMDQYFSGIVKLSVCTEQSIFPRRKRFYCLIEIF